MKVTISRSELSAALVFASENVRQNILNGVCVEVKRGKQPLLISTDGRAICVISTMQEQQSDEPGQFVLKSSFIKAMLQLSKSLGDRKHPFLEIGCEGGAVNVSFPNTTVVLLDTKNAICEGKFPTWREVVPKKKEARQPLSMLALNTMFIDKFRRAGRELGVAQPALQMFTSKEKGIVEVRIDKCLQFYGGIMQMNFTEPLDIQPSFLNLEGTE